MVLEGSEDDQHGAECEGVQGHQGPHGDVMKARREDPGPRRLTVLLPRPCFARALDVVVCTLPRLLDLTSGRFSSLPQSAVGFWAHPPKFAPRHRSPILFLG